MRYSDPSGNRCNPDDGCDTPHGDTSSFRGTRLSKDDESNNPEEELNLDSDTFRPEELLQLCTDHPFDSRCSMVFPSKDHCNNAWIGQPGISGYSDGCYYAGYHYEFGLGSDDVWQLVIDGLSIAGSLAPLIGYLAFSYPGAIVGEIVNIITSAISVAYNIKNNDVNGLTWDSVQAIGSGIEWLPLVGAAASAYDAADILGQAIVKVNDYRPIGPIPVLPE
jgi:hypothetical protein